MEWFNLFGLIFMVLIMIPNIIYAIKCPDSFQNKWGSKLIYILESIGRYGCFAFMVINIPGTWFGFFSDEAFAIYLIANGILVIAYCLIWIFCFRSTSLFRAITLSAIPAVVFLLSGILSRSVLLIICALVFAPSHVAVSVKNR